MVSGQGCGGADPVTAFDDDQSQTIAGRVTAVDGHPVAGADVTLEPLAVTTTTDGAGRFAFTVASSASGVSQYLLEVRSDGYEAVSLQVVVSSGGAADLAVTLEPLPSGAEPVPVPEPDPDSGIVVTTLGEDEVLCIAEGVELPFRVMIANEGSEPQEGVVLHDSLGTGFSSILTDSDVVVDRSSFPDAVVVLEPGGRSFRVELGVVPPMELTEVYTVTLPASGGGVFCNRVSAMGAGGVPLASDLGCLTNTLALEIDLVNDDGSVAGGAFSPEPEIFHVGDGGPDVPD